MPSVTEAVIQEMCSLKCFQILASRISVCPCFCFKKKIYFLLRCQLWSGSEWTNDCHREVFIILRESVTEVSQHTLATLCFAKGVREICQIPLLLYFSGSGALPPVITKCLWDYTGPRALASGGKTTSDICKTVLPGARASREKQSWRKSNIPHDPSQRREKREKNGQLVLSKSLREDQECYYRECMLPQIISHRMIKIAEIHV